METSIRRRRLPHWDVPGATYFITGCLDGSIPARGLLDIANYRDELGRRPRPAEIPEREWQDRSEKLLFARTDAWLDTEPAVRHLEDPRLAAKVVESFFHFADERYALLAFVVMPSHFHWVFRPLDAWVDSLGPEADDRRPRERIMHSLKTFTARECNVLLGRHGGFWQQESYDRCVRDEDELFRIIEYVERNPVKAGMVADEFQWKYSSASMRKEHAIRAGEAIAKRMRPVA